MNIKLLLVFFNLILCNIIQAQFNVFQNNNATQLAQMLGGPGVTITNATTTGNAFASGTFVNAPNQLGISNGVVLTTGVVTTSGFNTGIKGVINDSPSASNGDPGDADLNSISAALGETFSTLDAKILEFDIIVQGDSLVFDYVFGSEEYPDAFGTNFVCSEFGDVFGFFISGPKPAGGLYNNKNIALIPNTNTPITINTINNGVSGGANSANTCILSNAAFFNGSVPGITYNGFTQVFQAIAPTVPCQTYHIKLAIADGDGNSVDNTLDSGVFLREGSFTSIGTSISGSTNNVTQNNIAIEGCVAANFQFNIPSPLNINFIISYTVAGSAINGTDYLAIPNQITIPAGQTSATLNIIPFEDNLTEGTEEIKIYLLHPCNTNDPIDSASISVIDYTNPNYNAPSDTTICMNTTLQVNASGGNQYLWSPANAFSSTNTANTSIITNVAQDLIIEVIDGNNCSTIDTFQLSFHPPITANAGQDTSVCLNMANVTVFNTSVPLMATGGVNYSWTPNTGLSANNIANPIASPIVNTNYIVTVTDLNACVDKDTVLVNTLNPSLDLIQITTDSLCINDTVFVAVLDQGTITSYSWSPANFITNPNIREPGFFPLVNTSYTLSVQNYCYLKQDSVLIEVIPLANLDAGPLDSICLGETDFQLIATPNNLESYFWTSSDLSITNANIFNPLVSPTESSTYFLFAIDSIGNLACKNFDSVDILVHENPITNINFPLAYPGFICEGNSVLLTATSNDGINYNWDSSPFLNNFNSAQTSANPIDSTWFFVNITNSHQCSTRDSIKVTVQKPINTSIGGDSIMCLGQYVDLFATGGYYYHWYPENIFSNLFSGETQASPSNSITISVDIRNDCFGDTLYKNIIVNQLPVVDAGMDKTIVRDDKPAVLDGSGDGVPLWFTEDKRFDGIIGTPYEYKPSALPFNSTNYVLEITNQNTGCKNYDTMTVFVDIITLIALPTGFSPNADATNDLFRSLKELNIKSIDNFSVYNRYGENIYSGSGFNAAWDGTYKGTKVEIGVYTYYINATTKDDEVISRSGNISLIR